MAENTDERNRQTRMEVIRAHNPIASRDNTMYLQTIKECHERPGRLSNARDPCSLQTNEWQSNQRQLSKTEHQFNLQTADINLKPAPRELVSRPFHSLYNDDLPQTKSQGQKFRTNRLPTNPLVPEYPGNSDIPIEPVESRFLKDPLKLADIDGAQSHWRSKVKKTKLQNNAGQTHNYMPIVTCQLQEVVFRSQPQGSEPPAFRRLAMRTVSTQPAHKFSSLDVHDIAKAKTFQLSKRCVDPLNPTYFFYDVEKRPALLEPIKKSQSSIRHPTKNKADFTLETGDIEGARPVSNQFLYVHGQDRKTFTVTNDLSNIDKVAPGSHQKSIRTNRCINPLDRNYAFPEGFQEGFAIGSEFKDPQRLSVNKRSGKRMIDHDNTIREKNWNLINHRNKDQSVRENFRSRGKMIDPKWTRPDNNIFLLDCPGEPGQTSPALPRIPQRDPINGDGVEYIVLKATTKNDENVPCNLDLLKSLAFKNDVQATGPVNIGAKTQSQAFRFSTRPRIAKLPQADDFDCRVTFKPIQTTEQQFDAFISKEHMI